MRNQRDRVENELSYWLLVYLMSAIVAAAFGFGAIGPVVPIMQMFFYAFVVFFVFTALAMLSSRRQPR